MAGHHRTFTFAGVDVGLPSKVCGSEAEEEWQEVDWVKWSTGELTVDGDSYLLVFRPSGGAGAVKAKSLGALIRANSVAPDEGQTLVVSTSDALHRLYRLTFQSAGSAREFAKLAESAEAVNAAHADSKQSPSATSIAAAKLDADIRRSLTGRWPLVYAGAELCGPDPSGSASSKVLLGSGAAVLLDPADRSSGVVGNYELLFYGDDAGGSQPIKRMSIGPKMRLTKQPADSEDDDGPAVIYELQSMQGAPAHTLSFEDSDVAEGFARDFCVRQRLMELSLKTVARGRAAADLRSEIEGMKQRSFCARVWRFFGFILLLSLLSVAARVGSLYAKEGSLRTVDSYIGVLTEDALVLQGLTSNAGVKACELAVGSVPAADVQRCLRAPGDDGKISNKAVRRCVEMLVG